MTKKWYQESVVYQIYPRSFYDASGDGIGDLQGIIKKLDYLKDLKIGAIWLSPIFKSPMKDFGYDISDFEDIEDIFGSRKDLENLIFAAHQHNIKILLDFVPNHTSDQHPWFLESSSSKNNPKREWYIWQERKTKNKPPNNWLSIFGGSGWEFDPKTESYYFHSFIKEQPDLNWRNPEVKNAMFGVIRYWLEQGVDGFRMDAVNHIYKDRYLRDNPTNHNYEPGKTDPYLSQLNIYTAGLPETRELLKEFCKVLSEYPEKFMVTEIYAPFAEMMQFYRICQDDLHSPFNFNLISMPWNAGEYKKFVDQFEKELLPGDLATYVLGNHDKSRVASRIGPARARVAAMLQLTLRGLPFIYYGEEIGMENVPIPLDRVQDPVEKNVPGFNLGRDPERTPMQWNNSENAGFSQATPWLPVSEKYQTVNVETESSDPQSMFSLYKNLIAYRSRSTTLLDGKYKSIECNNSYVFVYQRYSDNERLLIILNFSEEEQKINLEFSDAEIIIDTSLNRGAEKINLKHFILPACQGFLVKL